MFNTNNYTSILFATMVCIALVATFSAVQAPFALESARHELDEKIAFWKKNEPRAYAYTIGLHCHHYEIVRHVWNINGSINYQIEDPNIEELNIDVAFSKLRDSMGQNLNTKVTYSEQGFPKSIIHDLGCATLISEFRELEMENYNQKLLSTAEQRRDRL